MRSLLLSVMASLIFLGGVAGPQSAAADMTAEQAVSVAITAAEREIIRRYFHDHRDEYIVWEERTVEGTPRRKAKGLPPGLAKKGALPPGLAKQLHRGGTLPPGLQKRLLPQQLRTRLSTERLGYSIIDDDVVLIELATRKIIDVLEDAF